MSQIEQLCDWVIWLEKGCVVAQGATDDVLELYNRYNAGKITLEEIAALSTDAVSIAGSRIAVDATDYSLRFYSTESKILIDDTYDYIRKYHADRCTVKVTKRRLKNKDMFLYFEFENPKGTQLDIAFDKIQKVSDHRSLYKKPPYDNRYGENRATGLYAYIDLDMGSAVVSKAYNFNRLSMTYTDSGRSELLELSDENEDFQISNSTLSISFDGEANCASLFILISKGKLFRDQGNLDRYMEYYYSSVENNSVWCSYFMLPSGTQTKLPYSIEPFTKEGYGYNLQHSSREDLIPFYSQTRERFFEDMINNAILQAYLYHNNDSGVFYSDYTSTWLKKDYGTTSPYVDTQLNEDFILMIQDFQKVSGYFAQINQQKDYMDYLCQYYEDGGKMYRSENGAFFPDYHKYGNCVSTHSSLNCQLGIARMFLSSYERYSIESYINMFRVIIGFVEDTYNDWINPVNGDIYCSVRIDDKPNMVYFGEDNIYATLVNLLLVQTSCAEIAEIGRVKAIDGLIESKVSFLKTTEFDLFNPQVKVAPGEKVDSRKQALKLYKDLFPTNEVR